MRISYAAANVACEAVYATYDEPAPFQMLQPPNGTIGSEPPTFFWTKGDYDLFRLYWYLPFYGTSGYVPIELGWTSQNFREFPSTWWPWLRPYTWAGSWLLGVNTNTLDYKLQGPNYFMRYP